MSALAPVSVVRSAAAAVTELRTRNRVLWTVAAANFVLAGVFTVLMALDGRTLLGRNVWTKPWKFATSIAIFTATMGWIMPSLSLTDRVEKAATYTIGGAMSIEIALISMQAARGVASHFNMSTAFDSSVFVVMGVTITISSVVVAYVLWRILRDPPSLPAAYRLGIVLGMGVFVVASFEGWLMVFQRSHSVGAPNASPGLPLLNWSMTGGDLRIAHFIGLHALQVLPLTGYVLVRWEAVSGRQALGGVAVVGTLYALVTGAAFWQAMLGTPLVASLPIDTIPSSVAAGVLLAATVCTTAALATGWRRATATRVGSAGIEDD